METFVDHTVIKVVDGEKTANGMQLIREEPLSIRLQGRPYSVVMRTPGDEIPHVAGFCLAEGIVDTPADFTSLAFCDGEDTNVVAVTLKPSHRDRIPEILERRNFVSQTSCGICGKELVEELGASLTPIAEGEKIDAKKAMACLLNLSRHQPVRSKTRAAHAAALYGDAYELISVAEDVGRHNALDKAVGKLFLDRKLPQARFLALSSRISYELVQKAARARIPAIFAMSRPTALAVELAGSLNMALVSLAKGEGYYVFCGEHRLDIR